MQGLLEKRKTKDGKIYIEQVKGYCCLYPGPYQEIVKEEEISYDHLFFALTIYGEARGESTALFLSTAKI